MEQVIAIPTKILFYWYGTLEQGIVIRAEILNLLEWEYNAGCAWSDKHLLEQNFLCQNARKLFENFDFPWWILAVAYFSVQWVILGKNTSIRFAVKRGIANSLFNKHRRIDGKIV